MLVCHLIEVFIMSENKDDKGVTSGFRNYIDFFRERHEGIRDGSLVSSISVEEGMCLELIRVLSVDEDEIRSWSIEKLHYEFDKDKIDDFNSSSSLSEDEIHEGMRFQFIETFPEIEDEIKSWSVEELYYNFDKEYRTYAETEITGDWLDPAEVVEIMGSCLHVTEIIPFPKKE
jgi:hypothetical protein